MIVVQSTATGHVYLVVSEGNVLRVQGREIATWSDLHADWVFASGWRRGNPYDLELLDVVLATRPVRLEDVNLLVDDVPRCAVCGWTLRADDKGCTATSCSYRPETGSAEYRRIQQRRDELARKAGS